MSNNNNNTKFYCKYVAFIINGIEDALFRDDYDPKDLFDSFVNLNFEKDSIDYLISELVRRNGYKFIYLQDNKKFEFVKLIMRMCENRNFKFSISYSP